VGNARTIFSLLLTGVLLGCAHPMTITSDIDSLATTSSAARIPKHVGLYIPAEDLGKQVTTSGGGGDKVTYRPYADMQTGIYKMLSNVFQDVTLLASPSNSSAISKSSLSYIVQPEITTSSSSSGILTWMATDFTVQLTCRISDPAGNSVVSVPVSATGHAEFSELKSDFSLAGRRAAQEALHRAQEALLQHEELKQ
jgi:hypothetical protein